MSNYTEELGINFRDAINIAEAYAGYAAALNNTEEPDQLPWIASCQVISAVFYLTVEPSLARPLFSEAASSYARLGLAVWRIYEICSQETIGFQRPEFNQEDQQQLNDEESFYAELQSLIDWKKYGVLEKMDAQGRRNRSKQGKYAGKIPNLNLPYSMVEQIIYDTNYWGNAEKYEYLGNFSQLITRIYEFTELNQEDEFRWENLQGPLLPFEPAGIALLVVFLKIWEENNSFESLMTNINLKRSARVLLRVVNELVNG